MTLTPSTVRLDLKCGKGSISPGEKCTKGAAQRRQETVKRVGQVALAAGLIAGAAIAGKRGVESLRTNTARKNKIKLRNMSLVRQSKWAEVWARNEQANKAGLFQKGKAQQNYQGARDRLYETLDKQRSEIKRMKRFAPKSEARRRAAQRGRRDSIWAEGFAP